MLQGEEKQCINANLVILKQPRQEILRRKYRWWFEEKYKSRNAWKYHFENVLLHACCRAALRHPSLGHWGHHWCHQITRVIQTVINDQEQCWFRNNSAPSTWSASSMRGARPLQMKSRMELILVSISLHILSVTHFFPFPALVEGRQSNPEDNSYTLDWFSVFTQYSGEQLPGLPIIWNLSTN